MKLIIGRRYTTPDGTLTYTGKTRTRFVCDRCNKTRNTTHEFCANWDAYQRGYVGDWYHYGTECVKLISPELRPG